MKAKILAGLFALAFLAACTSGAKPESADSLAADSNVVAVDTNTVDTNTADTSAVVAPEAAPVVK